jgi:predicted ester cyclase
LKEPTRSQRALVLRLYEEFDRGRLDAFEPSIRSGFSARVMGNQTLDWEGFKQFASQFRSAFPDGRHVFDHVVVDGESVATVGRYLGTHEGELMGIRPTGRRIELAVMHLDRIEDARVVEHIGIGNGLDLMHQLGANAQG